jgi:uncharacterized protein YfaS (alpha-2-macroglobulin family)
LRPSGLTEAAAVLVALSVVSLSVRAQEPIRVVRHTPVDTARSGDVITISFDRPVGGSLERSGNPRRFVRIVPALQAKVEWRDLVTLRVIPSEPLALGQRYRITIDTTLLSLDGGRLQAPYQFTVLARGPQLLHTVPGLDPGHTMTLDPRGSITLVYTAAVDTSRFGNTARFEIHGSPTCATRVIRYAASLQRALSDSDDYSVWSAGGWSYQDDLRFRRMVVLRPEFPPPEGCSGTFVLPSFDVGDGAEIRYPLSSADHFGVAALTCGLQECARGGKLLLSFTALVFRDSLIGRIHIEPAVPFTIDELDAPSNTWTLRLALDPRTTYRVRVDSTVRDVHGRSLAAPAMVSRYVNDRKAGFGHQLGLFTLSRQHAVLRVTHVNVDTAQIAIVVIPDSVRHAILRALASPDSVARMVGRLRDTVTVKAHLSASVNREAVTEIPIPKDLLQRYPGALFAIRARATGFLLRGRDSTVVPRAGNGEPRRQPTVRVIAPSDEEFTKQVALVQVTDLAAHARVSDESGNVFVTDINTGAPVPRADIILRDGQGHVAATGTTDETGIANLRTSADWGPSVPPLSETDPGRDGERYLRGEYLGGTRTVEVARGEDRSVVALGDGDYYESIATSPRLLDRSMGSAREVRAMVFTDRPIYRPGERVYVGSIARHVWLGALRPFPVADSVRIRVATGGGGLEHPDVVRDTIVRLNAFGTAADSFALGSAVPLGSYTVRLEFMTASGWWPSAFGTFQVAEYRAPQFRASLVLDSTVRFLADSTHARVQASYYFGAPMAGAIVRWRTTSSDIGGAVDITGLPAGFAVASRSAYGRDTPLHSGDQSGVDTLDARGQTEFVAPPVPGSLIGPSRVDVVIAVEDVDRQTVTVEQSTVVHSSNFYIAARDSARAWYWRKGQRQTLEVLAVRPDGRRVADTRIAATIVRHRGPFLNRMDPYGPTWRWVSDTIARDSIVTADSIVRFHLTPAADGSYEVLFTTRDEQGRAVSTSIAGYVIPSQWDGGWGLSPSTIAVRLARDTVSPGDTVRFSFISPFPRAEAWVTVAREGVLSQHRRMVQQGEWSLALDIDERSIPSATISVLLVDASPSWQTDSVHRRIRTGEAHLVVDRASKAITVDVRAGATHHAPGDSTRLTIRLRDHGGRPVAGHVTVWAVDESVLALVDSSTLNPLDSMYADRKSGLQFSSTASTMASLGHQLMPLGWSVLRITAARSMAEKLLDAPTSISAVETRGTGVRSKTAENIPRTDFRTTAFYLASLVADSNGVVTASAKLPDNLTTYRITAVAVTGDRFGAGELPLVVTKPLIARAALPRFVRTGDAFTAGAVVTNQTGAAITTTVRASATAVREKNGAVAERPLANGASSEVRFDWSATGSPGDTAVFRLAVTGGASTDAVNTPVPVRAPYSPRFHAVAGVVRGDEVIRIMLPRNIDPVRSRLTLRVGTTPIPAIHAAYTQLRTYPYLCTEQLASTGRAIIAMARLQKAGLLDSLYEPRASTLREDLQSVVDELTRRQSASGGIGYWSSGGWTSPSLSGYAGALLLDAREMGATVRPIVIARIVEYMQGPLERSPALSDTVVGTATQRSGTVAARLALRLSALHFLRRAGFPDEAREDELVALERQMVWQDRVWLAELMSRRENPSVARHLLADVWQDVVLAGTRVDVPDSLFDTFGFRSHIRPAARLLTATMAIDRDHPRLAQLIETVVQQGRATKGWLWNTQDYAAAVEALSHVAVWQRSESRTTAVVVRSARRKPSSRILTSGAAGLGVSATVSLEGLVERDGDWVALPLRVASGGEPVFYALTVEEVPLAPPATPDAKGIVVERWYERFDNGRPVTTVNEGDLVRARLRITVPSNREFVAVADPLPAGLEVVDLSLRTSGTVGPFETPESEAAEQAGNRANGSYYGSWYGGWWSPWEHHEIRDDRVVYFARTLWKGTYTASYVARATTAGTFVRPPAYAEEMYNPSLGGRSDAGTFRILPK